MKLVLETFFTKLFVEILLFFTDPTLCTVTAVCVAVTR